MGAAVLLFLAAAWLGLKTMDYPLRWEGVWEYRQKFVAGWWMTLGLSAASLALSLVVGLGLALARQCRWPLLPELARVYTEVVRGTPLLVQILVLFYGVFDQVGITDRFVAGVLILSGFSGAYIGEIIRAGIAGVGASQLESARAIGLTPAQTYRHVIFPQALRQILPPLAGQFASLVKDSSLLSIIGISEFALNAQEVNSFTYSTLESYLPLAAGYLALTLPISLWTRALERRMRFDT
jgi:polar amino acid transport system permease protein